jgi:phage baseplate assembly protein W
MTNIEYTISLPFFIGVTGSVTTTSDQKKIWADRVLSVIGTAVGERVQRYGFGSRVHYDAFETVTQAEAQLESNILEAFSEYLPSLSFNGIQTSYDQSTGALGVTVLYSLPDTAEASTGIGTVRINGTLPPKEL